GEAEAWLRRSRDGDPVGLEARRRSGRCGRIVTRRQRDVFIETRMAHVVAAPGPECAGDGPAWFGEGRRSERRVVRWVVQHRVCRTARCWGRERHGALDVGDDGREVRLPYEVGVWLDAAFEQR